MKRENSQCKLFLIWQSNYVDEHALCPMSTYIYSLSANDCALSEIQAFKFVFKCCPYFFLTLKVFMVYLLPNQTNRPSLLVFSCFSGCVISLPCRLKDQELLNHLDPWFQIEQDFWTKILQFFLLISDNLGGVSWFSFTCWSCKASTYLLNSKEPSSPDDKRVYV